MAKALRRQRWSETERFDRGLPTAAREAHGEFDAINGPLALEEGRYGYPRSRALDCLDIMLRRRTIQPWMHAAGVKFREDFEKAHLEPLRANDPAAVHVQMTRPHDSAGNPARDRVWEALCVLGGLNSPAGSCAWHVLGEGENVQEWATLRGWVNNRHAAAGVLIGTLGALGAHYGLTSKVTSN